MHLVVGLGNPGSRYAATRHNIGFAVVDRLAAAASVQWRSRQLPGAESETALLEAGKSEEVLLVKPATYMNRSGVAVSSLQRELELESGHVLVVVDDFNLEFSRLRLRRGGGDGGHNGLASILEELDTGEIPRLRIGIGRGADSDEDIDFVLSEFGPEEDVAGLVHRGCEAVETWIREGIEVAMNRFNGHLSP